MHLDDYLAQAAALPWTWGETDCCAFACKWVTLKTGLDPYAEFRGKFTSELAARRLIKRQGGLAAIVEEAIDRAGLERSDVPGDGDIGIVRAPPRLIGATPVSHELMAIRKAGLWVMRASFGVHAESLDALTSWKV